MFALFNNQFEFCGYSPDLPNNIEILKREIPAEQSDLTIWGWSGDYHNGSMVCKSEELEKKTQIENLNLKYPLQTQMVYMMRQLYKICSADPSIQNDNFMDMAENIFRIIDKYGKKE